LVKDFEDQDDETTPLPKLTPLRKIHTQHLMSQRSRFSKELSDNAGDTGAPTSITASILYYEPAIITDLP
jgi:hypothetical protein